MPKCNLYRPPPAAESESAIFAITSNAAAAASVKSKRNAGANHLGITSQ
ncbi:MAG: hypothetical protein PHD04_01275 [Candidatus Pacebacteria bacterium]|nr:hypothetical protein [Candidatus Paceibacterota bacterium]